MSREYVLHASPGSTATQINYAGELNEQQYAAVTAPPGPALVIAGAGSGKTRTLTYRVAWLLEQGVAPERMLLLTFTNKAAREMMRRVTELLGRDLPTLWGGTFHSIGNRILRQHAALIGWQRDFSILDREDALDLIKTCVGEAQIDTKSLRFPKADVLAEIFSLAANTFDPLPAVLDGQFSYFTALRTQILEVAQRYAERKRATNSMDFDDLLVQWLRLLSDIGDVREHYQRRFQFLLVDEYQDTNRIQSGIIDLLAARHHNVMVVGDDAQSIYAWRGANFANILKFPERHPGAKIYRIETNYRSTPEILEVANAAIAANVNQHPKRLVAARRAGLKPALVACHDAAQQAAFVGQRICELHEEGQRLREVAVLYRSHFHALELQLELTRRGIPFTITSGIRFFEQAHIKDVTAWMKLLVNPRDELAFKRLALMLPGVGAKAAHKLWLAFAAAAVVPETEPTAPVAVEDVWNPEAATSDGDDGAQPAPPARARGQVGEALRAINAAVPKKATRDWQQLSDTFDQLAEAEMQQPPSALIEIILEAGYEEYLQENYEHARRRLDDLESLADFARQFSGLEDFLTQLALLTNIEVEDGKPKPDEEDRVRLSTVHQAKGLEFDVVFVIMLCEGLLPNARALESVDGEEEERRLFYVAVTRARNELYLSHPLIRFGYGGGGDAMQIPSRFLGEIPVELLERWDLKGPAY